MRPSRTRKILDRARRRPAVAAGAIVCGVVSVLMASWMLPAFFPGAPRLLAARAGQPEPLFDRIPNDLRRFLIDRVLTENFGPSRKTERDELDRRIAAEMSPERKIRLEFRRVGVDNSLLTDRRERMVTGCTIGVDEGHWLLAAAEPVGKRWIVLWEFAAGLFSGGEVLVLERGPDGGWRVVESGKSENWPGDNGPMFDAMVEKYRKRTVPRSRPL